MSTATVPEFADGVFDDRQEVNLRATKSTHTTAASVRRGAEIFMVT
jgi:hypothetical protein